MKIRSWLISVPALLLAGLTNAQASELGDLLCRFLGWCGTGGNGGSGPHSVPEPEMLALFSAGMVFSAIAAARRRRK